MSKPLCIFQAPCWTRSGYGDLGLALAKSLLRYDKYELMIIPTRWGACSRKYLVSDISDSLEQELYKKVTELIQMDVYLIEMQGLTEHLGLGLARGIY